MDIGYLLQRIFWYMTNPEQVLPTASDAGQAAKIEKMRKGIADACEARREIRAENQEIAAEVLCLEIARQLITDQQRNGE